MSIDTGMSMETVIKCNMLISSLIKMVRRNPMNVISTSFKTTGSIMIESGIDDLAAKNGVTVDMEPLDDEDGNLICMFKVFRVGDIEVLQIVQDGTEEVESDNADQQTEGVG